MHVFIVTYLVVAAFVFAWVMWSNWDCDDPTSDLIAVGGFIAIIWPLLSFALPILFVAGAITDKIDDVRGITHKDGTK